MLGRHESGSAVADDQMARFLDVLWQAPIPTSPPPHDLAQGTLGLNLLAVALTMEHVTRLSEVLTLSDSSHLTRAVTMDIDLRNLTDQHKRALRSDQYREGTGTIWLPIARQARTDSAAVVVRDADGKALYSATQIEVRRALVHGLNRAFQMFLGADPRADDDDEELYAVRHKLNRSRWLIEQAIEDLIEFGPARPHPTDPDFPQSRSTDPLVIRMRAASSVQQLFESGGEFLRLLDIATAESLLVVEVPVNKPRLFLHYEAQVMPRSGPHPGTVVDRAVRSVTPRFTVQYSTILPRTVSSYHVTMEVPEELRVQRFFLTSNMDSPALRSLANDMRAVAAHYRDKWDRESKLLEYELQRVGSRLAEFGRRRRRDVHAFESYIESRYARSTKPDLQTQGRTRITAHSQERLQLSGNRNPISLLSHFANLYESGRLSRHLTDVFTPDILCELAEAIEQARIDLDVHVDSDPREHAGHAHWQRRAFGSEPQVEEPVEATVYVALVESTPALSSRVGKLLIAILLLVLGFGAVLEPDLFHNVPLFREISKAGAGVSGLQSPAAGPIVSILLLLMPVMLSRMDLSANRTVLARLRRLSHYATYSAGIVSVFLAICVASIPIGAIEVPFIIAILVLTVVAIFNALHGFARSLGNRTRVPLVSASPPWLILELNRTRRTGRRSCIAHFSPIGSPNNDQA